MTNLEKFEEVFGIQLDPNCIDDYASDFLCNCVHSDFCDNRRCKECQVKDFWVKEYVEKINYKCG